MRRCPRCVPAAAAVALVTMLVTALVAPAPASPTAVERGESPAAETLWIVRPGCTDALKTNQNGRVLARVDLGCDVRNVAVGGDAVWFTTDEGSVLRVDPETNEVVAAIPVGGRAGALTVGPTDVWVSDLDGAAVVRIDTRTNAVVARVAIGSPSAPVVGLAVGDGAVWAIQDFALAVVRIDAATNAVTGTVALCAVGECRVGDGAYGADRVWVVDCCTGAVRELNPVDLTVTPNTTLSAGVWELASDGGQVWALRVDDGRLVRLESGASEPVRSVRTRAGNARAPVVEAGSLWFVAAGDGEIVRVDTARGRVVRRLAIPGVRVFAVAD